MHYPFSVKICEFNGAETILPALFVHANPDDIDTPTDIPRPIKSVIIFTDDGEPEVVTEGRVYVMNEVGKTIARYTIGKMPE